MQQTYERVSEEMADLFYKGLNDREIERFGAVLEKVLANLIEAASKSPKDD